VDRAGGNPFYVTELLRAGAGTEGASVPAGVRDVVRRRLQRLAPTTAALLTTAAVVGTTVDIDLLDAVEGRDTLDAVEDAVAAHLLEETGERPGHYRFSHALVREVLLDELSALRRARLHATIARALDGRTDRDPETRLAELARHCCGGAAIDEAVAARAVTVSLEAAEQAMGRLGYDTARGHYERALAAVEDGADVAAVDHGALLVGLAAALRAEGDPAASREACLRAGELARRAGAPELLATAALGLALPGSVIGMDFGVLDEARIELLEEALRGLGPDDTPIRIRVLVHLGLALYLSDDRDRRDEVAAEAVAAADRLGHPGLRAAAAAARHSTLWGTPPVADRVQAAARIVELAESGGAPQTALEGHIALAIDLLEAGDLAGFQREVATVDRDAVALRQPFYQWYSRVFDATVASMEGRYADASAAAEAARAAGGAALGRRAIWGQIGWQYVTAWDAGGLEEAERPLRALASAFPDGIVVRCALAHVLAELGRRSEAAALAEPLLADPLARVPQDAMWLFSLALLAELAWLLEDPDGAARVAGALAPARGRLVVVGSGVACCGAVERSLGLVALAAGRVDEAEGLLAVALQRNRDVGARPWALRTMVAQASMLRVRSRPGDKERSQALLAEAASGAAGLGAHGLLRAIDRLREG
jgi:tetratricopeptide (TPR) repeat protein